MRTLIPLVLAITLVGCGDSNRYEMSKDAKGRTVRLDKKTGEVAVIGEDRITILKGQAAQELEAKMASSLGTPKNWPPVIIPPLGDLKATVTTSWQEEKLAYRFFVSPLSPKLETALKRPYGASGFTLEFYDDNGFKVVEVRLPLKSLLRNVNGKGEGLGLSANESTAISSAAYSKITGWDVLWYF